MKQRTARRKAIWAYNNREARHRPSADALPCVLRQYDRDVARALHSHKHAKASTPTPECEP